VIAIIIYFLIYNFKKTAPVQLFKGPLTFCKLLHFNLTEKIIAIKPLKVLSCLFTISYIWKRDFIFNA